MWTMGRERIRSVLTATMIEGSMTERTDQSIGVPVAAGLNRAAFTVVVVRAGGYFRQIDEEANVDDAPWP